MAITREQISKAVKWFDMRDKLENRLRVMQEGIFPKVTLHRTNAPDYVAAEPWETELAKQALIRGYQDEIDKINVDLKAMGVLP